MLNAGNIVFTPTANYNGAAAFTYTLSDGNSTATGNVNVTVNPVNDTPVANNDSGFTTPFQTALNIPTSTLLGNDTDADNDTLTVDSVGGAVGGTVELVSQSGVATFTPNAGHTGAASFTYTIKDPSNAQATATVSLTVGASGQSASQRGCGHRHDQRRQPGDDQRPRERHRSRWQSADGDGSQSHRDAGQRDH